MSDFEDTTGQALLTLKLLLEDHIEDFGLTKEDLSLAILQSGTYLQIRDELSLSKKQEALVLKHSVFAISFSKPDEFPQERIQNLFSLVEAILIMLPAVEGAKINSLEDFRQMIDNIKDRLAGELSETMMSSFDDDLEKLLKGTL